MSVEDIFCYSYAKSAKTFLLDWIPTAEVLYAVDLIALCFDSDCKLFWTFRALQEIEFLTSSIGQLKVAQTKYVDAKDSLNVLNKNNKGE